MGVFTGIRIEKSEIGAPREFDHLDDHQLLAVLRERFERLDSETRLALGNGSITLNGSSDDE